LDENPQVAPSWIAIFFNSPSSHVTSLVFEPGPHGILVHICPPFWYDMLGVIKHWRDTFNATSKIIHIEGGIFPPKNIYFQTKYAFIECWGPHELELYSNSRFVACNTLIELVEVRYYNVDIWFHSEDKLETNIDINRSKQQWFHKARLVFMQYYWIAERLPIILKSWK